MISNNGVVGNNVNQSNGTKDLNHSDELLKTLLNSSFDDLIRQPQKLESQIATLNEEKEKKLTEHSSLLVDVSESLITCQTHLSQLDKVNINELKEEIQELDKTVGKGLSSWEETRRAQNRLDIIRDHPDIVQILFDLPKLMSALITRNLNIEALSVFHQAHQLLNHFTQQNHKVKVLNDIVLQINDLLPNLIHSIFKQLSIDNLTIKHCIHLVACLRQTEMFKEDQLQVILLTCREKAYRVRLEGLPDKLDRRARNQLDLMKQMVIDTSKLYYTTFPMGQPIREASHSKDPESLFKNFVFNQLITPGLDIIREAISSANDAPAITSLLNHSSLIANQLIRYGLDFRPLLPDLFQPAVLNHFDKAFEREALQLKQMLSHRNLYLVKFNENSIGNDLEEIRLNENLFGGMIDQLIENDFDPPTLISSFQPFKTFLNQFLFLYNQLRTLALIPIAPELLSILHANLKLIAQALAELVPSQSTNSSQNQKLKFLINHLFTGQLVPYLIGSLVLAIFGDLQIFITDDKFIGRNLKDKSDKEILIELIDIDSYIQVFQKC